MTKDPVLGKTPKGTPVCRFTIASNRYYKSDGVRQEEVSFFEVETWSRLAETCGEYLSRGRGVRIVGRLKQDRWVNDKGEPRSRVHIVGDHVEFRSRPKAASQTDLESHDTDTASVAAEKSSGEEETDKAELTY